MSQENKDVGDILDGETNVFRVWEIATQREITSLERDLLVGLMNKWDDEMKKRREQNE